MSDNLLDQIQGDSSKSSGEPTGPMETLIRYADEMESLKLAKEDMERDLKEVTARYDELRKELIPEEMTRVGLVSDAGKGSFTLQSGNKIHLRGDLYAGYEKVKESEVFAWLKEGGHGALVKPTIHSATLRAFAKEQLADGVELPAELFKVHAFSVATLTRRK